MDDFDNREKTLCQKGEESGREQGYRIEAGRQDRSSRNGPEKDNVEKEGVVDHRETKRYVGERNADKTKQGVEKEKKKTVWDSSERERRRETEKERSLYSDQWMACPLLCLHFLWLTQ